MKHFANQTMVSGDIDLDGGQVHNLVLPDESVNIRHGKPGRLASIFGRLLFCVGYEIPGEGTSAPVWVPLLQEKSAYIHDQISPSSAWTIVHNFNTTRVLVQIWDSNNRVIQTEEVEIINNNSCRVVLASAISGYAVVMSGTLTGVDKPTVRYEHPFSNEAVVTVNHSIGYEPMVRVIDLEGLERIPQSIQHTSVNQTIVTLAAVASGKVVCV